MPSKQDNEPTYAEVMQQILDSIDGPIPVKEFSKQVLALRPSKAKNPLQAIRTQIRQQIGHLLVYFDAETILPVRLAMQGGVFEFGLIETRSIQVLLRCTRWHRIYEEISRWRKFNS